MGFITKIIQSVRRSVFQLPEANKSYYSIVVLYPPTVNDFRTIFSLTFNAYNGSVREIKTVQSLENVSASNDAMYVYCLWISLYGVGKVKSRFF